MRKPNPLKTKTGRVIACIRPCGTGFDVFKVLFDLEDAKKLFAWTGRALNYLEHQDYERRTDKSKLGNVFKKKYETAGKGKK